MQGLKVMFCVSHTPLPHLQHNAPYLPPKMLNNLCFLFLPGIRAVRSQEKMKTMLMQNFGRGRLGALGVHYRLRVVPHFPSRIVEQAKRERA